MEDNLQVVGFFCLVAFFFLNSALHFRHRNTLSNDLLVHSGFHCLYDECRINPMIICGHHAAINHYTR